MVAAKDNRAYFEWKEVPENCFDCDSELEVISDDDSVTISVTEEKAVDSYNATFTCSVRLPRETARTLRDFLTAELDKP